MKRKDFHRRRMVLPASFARPIIKPQRNLTRDFSPSEEPGLRAKRIFVIRQAIQVPPTDSAPGKEVQHIVIFDDHPDSLRLIFGEPENPHVDRAVARHVTSWVLLFSILMLGLLTAMFWPLF